MAYRKFVVDNVVCSRRFHISFDDEASPLPKTEIRCSYCDMIVFAAQDHPAAKLQRQENLIQTGNISDEIIRECHFQDRFSPPPTRTS